MKYYICQTYLKNGDIVDTTYDLFSDALNQCVFSSKKDYIASSKVLSVDSGEYEEIVCMRTMR